MQRKIKVLVALLAVFVIVVVLFAFVDYPRGNETTGDFQVKFSDFSGYSFHSQVEKGTQTQGLLTVNHTISDPVTVTISGSAKSWAYFARVAGNESMPLADSQYLLAERVNSVWMIVKIPENASSGAYQLTVTGNDTIGKTSSDTFTFNVA